MFQSLTCKPLQHRGESRIALEFTYNKNWHERVKKLTDARWSQTMHCWHIPDTPDNRLKCKLPIPQPVAVVVQTALAANIKATYTSSVSSKSLSPLGQIPLATGKNALAYINGNNAEQLRIYIEHLQLHAYSQSTIRTYRNEFAQLLQKLAHIKADDLLPMHLHRYFVYCAVQGLSEHTLHSRMNAIKYYYEQVLHRQKVFFDIPRPKKPLQLPKVLNDGELGRLFNALQNKKHKAILFTAYSAGLRVSEVVALKLTDIDSGRMQIMVRAAKGKKDRYVNLSPVLLDILRKYVSMQPRKPTMYLFESGQTGEAYPIRTVQQIFSNAKAMARIGKEVGIHSLRHTFATNLLEKGTDIRYIKDLLGHFNIKTTERYLHVSRQKLVNIASPLDELMNREQIDW